MKVIRLNFGLVEISLRLGGWWRTKEMQIRKYEIMPRNFLPEIKRSLARRLKSKGVWSAEDVNLYSGQTGFHPGSHDERA